MFKKTGYLICVLGLFFSGALHAGIASVALNDETPIYKVVFSGGTYFTKALSYPVTAVFADNMTAVIPFPDSIQSGADFNYTYDVTAAGKMASIFAGFDQRPFDLTSATHGGVEVGVALDDRGTLLQTLCAAAQDVPLYLVRCNVMVLNGVANMNLFLTDQKALSPPL